MPTLDDLKKEINVYTNKYRNPDLELFRESGLYDLFPEDNEDNPLVIAKWPEPFPHLKEAGVYAFLTKELEILYIGKASMNHGLGYRLGTYCGYDENRNCKLIHEWKGEPRYIYTVAMPKDSKFEAPALEEYLISRISTPNNKAGI
jgi:hypothetical protein